MKITLRQEHPGDYEKVSETIEEAFRDDEVSDHQEHILVDRLRHSDAFIPKLSIVAEHKNDIVGYVLLTPITIQNEHRSFDSLALAPLAVKPEFQGKGIGKKLMEEAHRRARELGFTSIVLIGHESYYPQFGYELTCRYGIEIPFEAPEANCMVIALTENGLQGVSGRVVYPKEFFE